MEVIKEFFSAIGGRLRSHFVGSILVSLILFNWNSILFLHMADVPVLEKIDYTAENWRFALPVIVGIAIALINPWIIVIGAQLAKKPSEILKSIQDEAKHSRAIRLIEFESTENSARSKAAQEVDDALQSIKDEDVRDKLKVESIDVGSASSLPAQSSKTDFFEIMEQLTPIEKMILKRMGKPKGALLTLNDSESEVLINGQHVPISGRGRYREYAENLEKLGLLKNRIEHSDAIAVYELTDFGNKISALSPTPPSN